MNYVLGFCFSKKMDYVLLIEKNTKQKKPQFSWMHGLLNGIGGHLIDNEIPITGMIREFKEETGLLVKNWKTFGSFDVIRGDGIVYLYVAKTDKIFKAKTVTHEKVVTCYLNKTNLGGFLENKQMMENLKFLIPMAYSCLQNKNKDNCNNFIIKENYDI